MLQLPIFYAWFEIRTFIGKSPRQINHVYEITLFCVIKNGVMVSAQVT